ncbi:MAG: 50S ribosomal protein L11 methyltransferase [Acidobacteria bacterium]|nr:50S ribosomal protein L11 methyltransferase [Acidobacteriota bacterium]MBI3656610.1 50S ribosomal protein L11 methyltransferase [Acidobacteriota bacterium]
MAKSWKALRIEINADAGDVLQATLWEIGMLGSVTEAEDAGTITILAYFDSQTRLSSLTRNLPGLLHNYGATGAIKRMDPVKVTDTDWVKRWKESYTAFTVGDRFMLTPTWESAPQAYDRIVLRMDPGMAFGSGTHESTKLCLLAIEKYYKPGRTFLDVGTGSGILALAAAKMIACAPLAVRRTAEKSVTAVDVDPVAIKVAKKNFRLNRVSRYVAPDIGALEKLPRKKYDFVAANLTAKDLITHRQVLMETLKRDAWLILSGILREQDAEVMTAFTQGSAPWTHVERLYLNEWFGLALRR